LGRGLCRTSARSRHSRAKGCEREGSDRCCLAPGVLGESACWCRRGDGLRGLALCRRRRATPDERPGSRTRCGQSSALAASAESRRELRPRGLASRSPARISRSASASSIPRCTAIRRALVSADAVTSTRRMPSLPASAKDAAWAPMTTGPVAAAVSIASRMKRRNSSLRGGRGSAGVGGGIPPSAIPAAPVSPSSSSTLRTTDFRCSTSATVSGPTPALRARRPYVSGSSLRGSGCAASRRDLLGGLIHE
jgi:hypothetical protein